MAERSTAAVDVANEGGKPLAAEGGKATTDAATAESTTQDAKRNSQEKPAPTTPNAEPPELHSGHTLGRRYRLEECLDRADAFSSWRAVDEKLRRAVGVHVLPVDHPRTRGVLAAARSAALLGEPRFVQVLDAVEEDDLVHIVHEWLPDATDLAPLLAAGPLEAHEAYQMVSQLSQAMAAAHREGLAHLRLGPATVLRTESGQYRIRGLAVDAALYGMESDRPKRQDTEAIGALLYAALTARWPYPQDAHGLTGLPKNLGLVSPEQVRAGVHRGLSELTMRALVNDGATPSRQSKPCTTPEELAKAVAAMPKIRPPEPDVPAFKPTSYRQPPARPAQPAPAPRQAPAPTPPPPALPGRAGKAIKWGVAALLIAALGLGSWEVADTLLSGDGPSPSTTQAQRSAAGSTSAPHTGAGGKPLTIVAAQEYEPDGSFEHPDQVKYTYDHKPTTYWRTMSYQDGPKLAPYKPGVGIVYDLGGQRNLTGATVSFYYSGSYTAVSLYAADSLSSSTPLSGLRKLTSATTNGTTATLSLKSPVNARYVVVWLTALPREPDDGYSSAGFKQGITEVSFLGT